jgi:cytochrome P450
LTVIEKRKREGTASNDEDNDILNLLLNGSTASENSELAPLNEYELISDSFIMIVAGHEVRLYYQN